MTEDSLVCRTVPDDKPDKANVDSKLRPRCAIYDEYSFLVVLALRAKFGWNHGSYAISPLKNTHDAP